MSMWLIFVRIAALPIASRSSVPAPGQDLAKAPPPAGLLAPEAATSVGARLVLLEGPAFDGRGNLFLGDIFADRICRLRPEGKSIYRVPLAFALRPVSALGARSAGRGAGPMRRLAWLIDAHPNFVTPGHAARLYRAVREARADAVLLGGDIGEATGVEGHLEGLADRLGLPVDFVLGDHDDYRGSIARVCAGIARQTVPRSARRARGPGRCPPWPSGACLPRRQAAAMIVDRRAGGDERRRHRRPSRKPGARTW